MALIKPCPAPPFLAIIPEAAEAGVVAGDASATAGEVGTAAAEGGVAAGEATAPTVADAMSADGGLLSDSIQNSSILEVLNARVGSDVTTDANAASEASSILQTIKNAGVAVTPDETNTKQYYDVSKADEGSVVVARLPLSCMAEVQAWNAHPLIGQLAVVQRNMTVANGSAVEMDGLPDYTVNAFKAKIAHGGTGFGSGKM